MSHINHMLFLISKESGLSCLKSFVRAVDSPMTISVYTLDDSDDSRSALNQIESYCNEHSIDFTIVGSSTEFIKCVSMSEAQALFVCGWYWLIPEKVLEQVGGRIYGIHHSLLPKYRGFSPLVWSMINGDEYVGSSLFKLEDGIDTGDVYHQWKVKVNSRPIAEVLQELETQIEANLGHVLCDVLQQLNLGWKQDASQATYCARRTSESGLINWNWSAQSIVNFINAQSFPYPGAYFIKENEKFTVQSAEVFEHIVDAAPGQVALYHKSGVVIGCGKRQGVLIKAIVDYDNIKSVLSSHDLVLSSLNLR